MKDVWIFRQSSMKAKWYHCITGDLNQQIWSTQTYKVRLWQILHTKTNPQLHSLFNRCVSTKSTRCYDGSRKVFSILVLPAKTIGKLVLDIYQLQHFFFYSFFFFIRESIFATLFINILDSCLFHARFYSSLR